MSLNDDELYKVLTETHVSDQAKAAHADAARATFSLYSSYRDAGFSHEDAFRLVRDVVIAMAEKHAEQS